jgi:hypothetical protein
MSKPIVVSVADWNPSSVKYMAPKLNKQNGKAISIISKQSNRSLHISTPLMMTWGVSDFVDDKGESDGKYSISLVFPNDEYSTPATSQFLQKLKEFENQILDDAVRNSELWWGEEMSREVVKHTFFPFLKYSKNKDTKKIDYTRPPTIRAKVPYYENRWGIEIYDTNSSMIFPKENSVETPVDLIPKQSSVACILQCGGIWIGGKGWGLTWKLIQCVVKPREVISVFGKCHVQLSVEDKVAIETQEIREDVDADSTAHEAAAAAAVSSTAVEDSDDDEPVVSAPAPVQVPVSEPVAAPTPVKKVVKKAADPEPVPEPTPAPVTEEPVAKKVVKKVVKKAAA